MSRRHCRHPPAVAFAVVATSPLAIAGLCRDLVCLRQFPYTWMLAPSGPTKETTMNLRNRSAWVRAAGLSVVMGLVACDGGGADTKADKKAAASQDAAADAAKKAAESAKVAAEKATAEAKAAADKAQADAKAAADKAAADAQAAKAADDAKLAGIDGKALYEAKCKSCHLVDGKGSVPMQKNKIPNLTDPAWQAEHDRAKIAMAVTDGVKDTKMQSFKAKLKPEEIEAIAVYVKTLK